MFLFIIQAKSPENTHGKEAFRNLFEKHSVMTIAASFFKGLPFFLRFRGPAVNYSFYGNERQRLHKHA